VRPVSDACNPTRITVVVSTAVPSAIQNGASLSQSNSLILDWSGAAAGLSCRSVVSSSISMPGVRLNSCEAAFVLNASPAAMKMVLVIGIGAGCEESIGSN
jgi:hypothetical protein